MKDDQGETPLDRSFNGEMFKKGCFDVALYLLSLGCGGDSGRKKLLCGACRWGKMDLVRELVEQQNIDPNSMEMLNNYSTLIQT